MKIEELKQLRQYAVCLENGVDPTSGIEFVEDTVLVLPQIKSYNKKVRELIDALLRGNESYPAGNKIPFFLTDKEINEFLYSDTPISISKLCYIVNNDIPCGMKKIYGKNITYGLLKMGFLQMTSISDDEFVKIPTEKGSELGISIEKHINKYGNEYSVNLYNINAQKFIITHLEEIIKQ
jgi:hypothetical protein